MIKTEGETLQMKYKTDQLLMKKDVPEAKKNTTKLLKIHRS